MPSACSWAATRRRLRRGGVLLIVGSGLHVAAAGAASPVSTWQPCGAGHGGAFSVRVYRINCAYAQRVTENGLSPNARRTRKGSFRCARRRNASALHVLGRRLGPGRLWVYRCLRHQGRQGLAFDTYYYKP